MMKFAVLCLLPLVLYAREVAPLADVSADAREVREAFNAARGKVRLLVLVSSG